MIVIQRDNPDGASNIKGDTVRDPSALPLSAPFLEFPAFEQPTEVEREARKDADGATSECQPAAAGAVFPRTHDKGEHGHHEDPLDLLSQQICKRQKN